LQISKIMKLILNLLDYSEYLIPIAFFAFAHIVDTKVHKVWEGAGYHPNEKIRMIHHYQWEACFLMISLLAILGVKIAHKPPLFYAGLWLYGISFVLMSFLFLLALDIVNRSKVKMSALPLYLAITVYISYITADMYLLKLPGPLLFKVGELVIYNYYVFVLTGFICILSLFFLKRWIDWQLYTPDLEAGNIQVNKSVYNSKYSSRIKKAEALYYILKYYQIKNQPQKIKKWRHKAATEIPKEMEVVVRYLKAE
jgi:hypothetical protein